MSLHRHRWAVIGSHVMHYRHGDETDVLEGCQRCDKRRSRRHRGAWSFSQLGGKA